MKSKSLLLTIGFVLATGHAAAQTTAVGPYYATPSWDQTMPATTRFVILSNFDGNAVLDRETGLVWQRALSATPQIFSVAASSCAKLVLGNRLGWHLPSHAELTSLFDPSALTAPFLPVGHPFTGFTSSRFLVWSNTKTSDTANIGGTDYTSHAAVSVDRIPTPTFAPFVSANDGGVQANFLCVRGGPGPDFLF